jgi:hypothetical protein
MNSEVKAALDSETIAVVVKSLNILFNKTDKISNVQTATNHPE